MQSSTTHELVLVGERSLKNNITLMSWSSKRDLLCMATTTGDLLLYRLSSLEKVWHLSPPEKERTINAICWRPDGSGKIKIGTSSVHEDTFSFLINHEKSNPITVITKLKISENDWHHCNLYVYS